MRKILLNIFPKITIWGVLFLLTFPVWASVKSGNVDVRILVDVSGSMKRNDPQHLRRPAVRLLSGILPKNARAGIWMFAQNSEPLVAVGKVNSSWKKKVRKLAKNIHNRGLFTNIGEALETAAADWDTPAQNNQRIIVLLTDGMVDISKDDSINKVERLRIQNAVIAKLKKSAVRIYTIALSDEADKQLLEQISNATDAWFESVKNADELEKVFLKIFEQSVNVPEVPVTDNKFKIDHSIKEFTALVFKKNDDAIYLESPSGRKFEAETMDSSISWFIDEKFDLITITKPEAGQWRIIGPVDPDNRVMVVSDLKLDVNNDELPANLVAGEELILKVSLQEKNKIIKRATFLSLVNFVGQIAYKNKIEELSLQDDGEVGDEKKEDGIFSFKFIAPKIDGEVSFDLRIVSPTFERLYNRSVRIYSSYVKIETKLSKAEKEPHEIIVIPVKAMVDSKKIQIKGILKNPEGSEIKLEFARGKNGSWIAKIQPDNKGGIYQAILQITGETFSGKSFTLKDNKVSFQVEIKNTIKDKEKPTAEPKKLTDTKKDITPGDKKNKVTENDSKSKPDVAIAKKEATGLSSLWWIIIGVGFNILFLGGGFYAWKKWKKKQSADGDALVNELEDDTGNEKKNEKASKKKKGE